MARERNERVLCGDGFSMSVQAHDGAYCSPRVDNAPHYTEVEIGFPSCEEVSIERYAEDPENPTQTVYGYVPSDIVRHIIDKHGGIVDGQVPKGVPVYGFTHSRKYKGE